MVTQRRLSESELLLLTAQDDTEEAPWMVMPDFQWRVISLFMSILRLHVRRRGLRWYLAAELKVTMPRPGNDRPLDFAPDLMMAEAEDIERTSWNVRAEGPPPFVLEVVTEESKGRDTEDKPPLYEAIGVREYAIFAPRARDGDPKLFGYRRDDEGRFVPWRADADGILWSTSLELGLYVEDGKWLRVRDAQGHRLPSAEEEAARAEQEATRAEEQARRAEQEAAARRDAEAELEKLRALLQRQTDE